MRKGNIMNQYERKQADKIKAEIREYEEKNGKMPKEKKAYYIYRRLGQIYFYKEAYSYADSMTMQEFMKKIEIYREGVTR